MDSRVQGRHGPATYVYRRELGLTELLPAAGAGLVVGLAAFYVARLLLQRTALATADEMAVVSETGHRGRRPVSGGPAVRRPAASGPRATTRA